MRVDRLEVERSPGLTVWRLPGRELGPLRIWGLAGLAASLGIFLFAWVWGGDLLLEIMEDGLPDLEEWNPGELFRWVFLLPFGFLVVLGLRVLWTGLAVCTNRTRTVVEADREEIRIREILGGWRKKRTVSCRRITAWEMSRGVVDPTGEQEAGRQSQLSLPEDLWTLRARSQEGSSSALVVAYPRRILHEIATHLCAQFPGIPLTEGSGEETAPEAHSADVSREEVIPDPPAGSRVEMQQVPDGVGFSIPAQGVFKGSHGLFVFGLIFDLFPTFFLVILLTSEDMTGKDLLIFGAFLSVFFLTGTGLMLSGLAMGTRRAVIAARAGRLRVETTSVFGTRQREWAAGDLQKLEVAHTGTRVNNRPLSALYIEAKDGTKTSWLQMLSRTEQDWIAAHLRNALHPYAVEI